MEEVDYIRKSNLYTKVPIKECFDETGAPPVGTKWIDINKGDDEYEEYRSRLVAKEIKTDKREDLFAATPPLKAIKILLSCAVTQGIGYKEKVTEGMKIDFVDTRRACFHARIGQITVLRPFWLKEANGWTC